MHGQPLHASRPWSWACACIQTCPWGLWCTCCWYLCTFTWHPKCWGHCLRGLWFWSIWLFCMLSWTVNSIASISFSCVVWIDIQTLYTSLFAKHLLCLSVQRWVSSWSNLLVSWMVQKLTDVSNAVSNTWYTASWFVNAGLTKAWKWWMRWEECHMPHF